MTGFTPVDPGGTPFACRGLGPRPAPVVQLQQVLDFLRN